ncbi:oxidoreductase [Caballeronia sp. INDeC2]|uniref:oxidoreductase n=1 Tax=Caballeronia sp. INDeC2 TaxID=2921747 RepID=UPI0020286081|nr:oxidoreductase [Caballeronia sp. INDeC2]
MPMTAPPTIALVGPGAIGTTVAAALHEADRTPALFGRTAHDHLELRFEGGRIRVPGPVRTDPADIETTFDLVFVAVKTTQVEAASKWLSALCSEKTVACVLQNGVEQKTLFAPYLSRDQVLPSAVWFPAQRESDASVWLRAKPKLTLPDTPAARIVLAALRDTRCSVEVTEDFTSAAWRKLLQNAVAGLMVLTGRRAGMYSRSDIETLSIAYLNEVIQEIVDAFKCAPAELGTSILADRQARRPLEWDTRNGVIQRCGQAHGIPSPVSDLIVPLLAAASDGPG